MRKLTFLFVALLIAFYGQSAIAGAEPIAAYILRDGLILLAIGALIFAANSSPLPLQSVSGVARQWPMPGRLLLVAAIACTLASAGVTLLLGVVALAPTAASVLWLLGLALFIAGVWWPGGLVEYSPPAYRWSVDAAGKYVRLALQAEAEGGEPAKAQTGPGEIRTRLFLLLLLVAFVATTFVRLWRLAAVPPDCIATECVRALQLVEGVAGSANLYDLLALALFRISGDALFSLRLAGALLGIATIPLFYWAGRSYTRSAGATLATLLLALSPWHIWASRTSDPWIVAPLLVALILGTALRAWRSLDRRWWAATGIAFGLLLLESAGLGLAGWLWFLVAAGLGFWSIRRLQASMPALFLNGFALLMGAVVVALPVVTALWRTDPPLPSLAGSTFPSGALLPFLTGIFYGGGTTAVGYFLDNPLLSTLAVVLAALGIGRLLRYILNPQSLLVMSGLLILALAIARMDPPGAPLSSLLLVLLPFLFIGGAVALDELLWSFNRAWYVVVAPARVISAVTLILLLFGGWNVVELMQQLRTLSSAAQTSVDVAMGRYLARCLAEPAQEMCMARGGIGNGEAIPSIYYVPPSVLDHPSTRLLLGDALDSDQVRALDVARDIPPSLFGSGDLVYLVSIDNQPVIDLLQQLYPAGQIQAQPQDSGPTSFVTYRILRENLLNRQGLLGFYHEGPEFGSIENAAYVSRDGPLHFDWAQDPPMAVPFSVLWEGSLLVPAAGAYAFSVDLGAGDAATQPFITLQLDDSLILDTSLGLSDRLQSLAQGFYRFTLRYRTDTPPADWSLSWQPPDGEPEVIPRHVLFSPALPDVGLIGTYYAGDQLQGPTLATRKDLVLDAAVNLPRPFSVIWRGKLAAPRAGEYLFAVTGDGATQLLVDGLEVLNYFPKDDALEGPQYAQSSIYLPKEWHDIEIRYIPETTSPDLRILWQPPGSSPARLLSRYLRPITAEVQPADIVLPPPPDLLDERLGDDEFALSYTSDLYQLGTTSPPHNLPPLLLEQVWQVGGACSGGPEQLNLPHGVAIDGDGRRIFVADTGNLRIVSYDLDDGAQRGVYASDEFQEPVDVEVATDGTILVLDATAQQLFRIEPSDATISPMPLSTGFYRPRGLAVDLFGNVLVADTGGGRVAMLDPTGGQMASFGGAGTALGNGQPVDVLAAGDNKMWAITAEDGRLWRLDTLSSITAIPRANTLDGPHLAGLPDGTFFLSDPVRQTVLYHAANGQPLRQFAYPDVFLNPTGVGAAQDGELVYLAVADSAMCTLSLWRTPISSLQP